MLQQPELQGKIKQTGATPESGSPEEFGKLFVRSTICGEVLTNHRPCAAVMERPWMTMLAALQRRVASAGKAFMNIPVEYK